MDYRVTFAIPSALLNESATLFRRKYYINGSRRGIYHVHYDRRSAGNPAVRGREQHPPL